MAEKKLADVFNDMIKRAMKNALIVSPRFQDYRVVDIIETDSPDIEGIIGESVVGNAQSPEKKKEQKEVVDKVKKWEGGNIGEIEKMTKQQFGNVQELARDPFQFIFGKVFKKFSKGAGVLFLATLIGAAVQYILFELMKPGRPFDRRFKREVRNEILLFNNAREQQELRQGFKSVIVTSIGYLRAHQIQGNYNTNLFNPTAQPADRIDPRRDEPENLRARGRKSYAGGRRSAGGRR